MRDKEGSPEPKPNWYGGAQDTLGWLWPAHVYLFAVLFVILGLITVVAIALTPKRNKHFIKMVMLCAVIALSVSRSVTLFVDPYLSGSNPSIWWKFGYVLVTGLGSTSLTASLAILLYITTISTRITSKYRRVNLGRVVAAITIGNFVFFIASDVITMLVEKGKIMLTICQITFAIWGVVVSLGFGVLTYKLRTNAQATFEQAKINTKMRIEGRKLQKLSVMLAILSVTAGLFFLSRISEAITGMTNKYYIPTWPWWSLQTALRTLEIMNANVLLLVFKKEVSKAKETEPERNISFESEKLHAGKKTSDKSGTVSDFV